jgi:NAD(P)H-hydrate epimerase
MRIVTAEAMRRLDRKTIEEAGIPGMVLMENAGRGAAGEILRSYPLIAGGKVAVVAGKGNNGGDGMVIARYLINRGCAVTVLLLASPEGVAGDARANLDILLRMKADIREVSRPDAWRTARTELPACGLIVDAIFGTGLASDVSDPAREVINDINAAGVPVVSVDLPSGLHADTGRVLGACVKADLTVTFALPKAGLFMYPGAGYAGRVRVVDISIPASLIEGEGITDRALTFDHACRLLRPRDPEAHKGDCGHVLVVAGTRGKTGAADLCCRGAAGAGAGLVTLAIPESLNSIMEMKLTEVMTEPIPEEEAGFHGVGSLDAVMRLMEGKKALALGPGLSTREGARRLIHGLIEQSAIPLVIDADGLTALSGSLDVLGRAKAPVVLTPHPGEMARLTGSGTKDVQRDRPGAARDFARRHGCCLVLKGARTLVAAPDGSIAVNLTGNAGMASGGMGDVLTGMIAGFIAQGYDGVRSAHLAVFCHGLAGDLLCREQGPLGFMAGDLLRVLPRALRALAERTSPVSLGAEYASLQPMV